MFEWLIGISALAAIAWVNWYFFMAPQAVGRAHTSTQGVQEVVITVDGGYSPSVAKLTRGTPARIVFDRKEKSPCSNEVVISKAGIRRFLKPYEKTAIEFTPAEAGVYEFTCGMNMLKGRLEVEG